MVNKISKSEHRTKPIQELIILSENVDFEYSDCLLFRNLISSHRPKFSSRWWKFLLCFGSILVLSGLFLLVIGFFLPRKKINVDSDISTVNSQILIIDRKALSYNTNLDTSHLLGICFVVIGGVLFTLSLLIPTFCHMWCASGDLNDETDPLKVKRKEIFC
jgi:hypothetical protein